MSRLARRLVYLLRVSLLWILLAPYPLIGIGTMSNQLVLWANHDQFPVLMRDSAAVKIMPDGFDDSGHILMTSETHLNPLGDIFDFHAYWGSVGDMLIDLGEWMQSFCPYVFLALVTRKLVVAARRSEYSNET